MAPYCFSRNKIAVSSRSRGADHSPGGKVGRRLLGLCARLQVTELQKEIAGLAQKQDQASKPQQVGTGIWEELSVWERKLAYFQGAVSRQRRQHGQMQKLVHDKDPFGRIGPELLPAMEFQQVNDSVGNGGAGQHSEARPSIQRQQNNRHDSPVIQAMLYDGHGASLFRVGQCPALEIKVSQKMCGE